MFGIDIVENGITRLKSSSDETKNDEENRSSNHRSNHRQMSDDC